MLGFASRAHGTRSCSSAQFKPLFAQNPPENWFSDGIYATSIGSRAPNTSDECRVNPGRFRLQTGGFQGVLASGILNIREEILTGYILNVRVLTLW